METILTILPEMGIKKATKPFAGNNIDEVRDLKKRFVTLLESKGSEEFATIIAMAESVSKLGPACTDFLDNYFAMYKMFEEKEMNDFVGSRGNGGKFPKDHVLSDIFLGNRVARADLEQREIPRKVQLSLFAFYAEFLAPDAKVQNPYLSVEIRTEISRNLINLNTTGEASVDIFDDAASIALETLFWIAYPKYLNYKGDQPSQNLIYKFQKEWEKSIGSTFVNNNSGTLSPEIASSSRVSVKSKESIGQASISKSIATHATSQESSSKELSTGSPRENSIAPSSKELSINPPSSKELSLGSPTSSVGTGVGIPSPQEKKVKSARPSAAQKTGFMSIFIAPKMETSKESMISVLQTPKLYKKFEKFVKGQHCEENLKCYQAFLKLESRSRKIFPSAIEPCLGRFLDQPSGHIDRTLESNLPVPITIIPLFLLFNGTFIAQGSENEVNIPSKVRLEIEKKIKDVQVVGIPMDVFDHAIDHVLELLYLNSYSKFAKK